MARDPVLTDFEQALRRLLAGKPTSPRLSALAKEGTVKINVSTVAEEAGRSRTLIGHTDCQYRAFRQKILALRKDGPEASDLRRTARELLDRVHELERVIQVKDSVQASLLLRIQELSPPSAKVVPIRSKGD